MADREFRMRLSCQYQQPENEIAALLVEVPVEGEWKVLDLNTQSPGFQIFVYAEFHCQHTYMRLNCAEKGVVLLSSEGSIQVVTNDDWDLKHIEIEFRAKAASGTLSEQDRRFVQERMELCPVSKNVKVPPGSQTRFSLT